MFVIPKTSYPYDFLFCCYFFNRCNLVEMLSRELVVESGECIFVGRMQNEVKEAACSV